MENIIVEDDFIAEQAFKFFINSFIWKNRNFDIVQRNMSRKHNSFRKKYFLLSCISVVKDCTLTELEKRLCENRSTISVAVSKLCDEGLVKKHQPKRGDDGRKVYFRITKEGGLKLNEYQQFVKEDIKGFLNLIPEESKLYFLNGVESFNKALEIIGTLKE